MGELVLAYAVGRGVAGFVLYGAILDAADSPCATCRPTPQV